MSITIGIIGGSGLYDMGELTEREERSVTTPIRQRPTSSARCAENASRSSLGTVRVTASHRRS